MKQNFFTLIICLCAAISMKAQNEISFYISEKLPMKEPLTLIFQNAEGESLPLKGTELDGLEQFDHTDNGRIGYRFKLTKKQVRIVSTEDIETIIFESVKVQQFDASKCPTLKTLKLKNSTQLEQLSVNEELVTLDARNGKLATLNLSHCNRLEYVNVNRNKLTRLSLPESVVTLACSYNQLTDFNFTHCTNLRNLALTNNALTGESFTTLANQLPHFTVGEHNLYIIDAKKVTGYTANAHKESDLTTLYQKHWKVYGWNADNQLDIICLDGYQPPFVSFVFPESELNKTIEIAGDYSNLISTKGLKKIYSKQDVAEGDRYLITDRYARIEANFKSFITLRNTTEAEEIVFGKENDMEFLSLSDFHVDTLSLPVSLPLKTLACTRCNLEELNVNASLEKLYCTYNQLEKLDLSIAEGLKYVSCHENKITGAAMTQLIHSLPEQTPDAEARIIVRSDANEAPYSDNTISHTDISLANAKHWRVFGFSKDWDEYEITPAAGIDSIETRTSPKAVYSIHGQRLPEGENHPQGIYIIDGRKTIIR
ncbi:MAG: hypothetical protein SOZ07_00645 [Prevotella sp.]|nr:hypothetical protein [Prevotellaceae bacterium]MDY3935160.1 hypothetical protein [Prevotella sp.]